MHVIPKSLLREDVFLREPHFLWLYGGENPKVDGGEGLENLLHQGEIEGALIFGFAFRDPGLCREVNDYVFEVWKNLRRSYRYVAWFCVVNPTGREAVKEVERCRGLGASGVGELFPHGQGFDLGHPEDVSGFFRALEEMGMPTLIHVNEPVGKEYPGKGDRTTPKEAFSFVKAFPELRVIFAHLGGGLIFYEYVKGMRDVLRNVFFDTSAINFIYTGDLLRVLNSLNLDKVLFGSDFPLLRPSKVLKFLEGLDEQALEKICWENAMGVLGDAFEKVI